jgi:hypothetical protein
LSPGGRRGSKSRLSHCSTVQPFFISIILNT